jgi:TolB-like protein/DNA-binding winged helix-turn-helix (wHTH) protein/Tfp pilus assembly protein PilF
MIFRFEDIELDSERFELRRGGAVQKVEPQVFALLEFFFSNPDRMISKDELNQRIWAGRIVSDAVVNSRIRSARQAIGDDGKAQRLIKTVHSRGFRFIGVPEVQAPVASDTPAIPVVEVLTAPLAPAPATLPNTGPPSIAVLPFQALSGEPPHATLADAVAHEIIVELSRLHWLFVIARGSSFQFREADVDLRTVGERLGARYLLTGTMAIEAPRSVVTVELVQAADRQLLWAERFEGPVGDLLGLRSMVAREIVNAIDYRIPIAEASRTAALPTESLDAWAAYHRGLWHMYRFNARDNALARQLFEQATKTDPHFARAHAGLSFTHFQNAFVGYTPDTAAEHRLTREFAERSLALDPLDPFGNLSMGRAEWLDGDLERAFPWYDRCIELNPNYAFAHYNRALADVMAGRSEQSDVGVGKAMALSPLDPLRYAHLATRAFSYIVRGDPASACEWAEKGARAPNAHVHIFVIAAIANELAGKHLAAEAWAADVRRRMPDYRHEHFFKAFPFRDAATCADARNALMRLGL